MTPTDLCDWPATRLAQGLRDGEISTQEVTRAHLERIERVNPLVNAVVTLVADRAMQAAERADAYAATHDDLPPLHGIPVLHKDTHATAGIRTTSGSPLLAQHVPDTDDLVIERIRGGHAPLRSIALASSLIVRASTAPLH